eukprot:gene9231-10827_t
MCSGSLCCTGSVEFYNTFAHSVAYKIHTSINTNKVSNIFTNSVAITTKTITNIDTNIFNKVSNDLTSSVTNKFDTITISTINANAFSYYADPIIFNITFTNCCSILDKKYMKPQGFNPTNTVILDPLVYPAVKPVYYRKDLGRSAKMHSVDLATTPCFQHQDCNGTSPKIRVDRFFTSCGPGSKIMSFSENISADEEAPLGVVGLWICETPSGTPCNKDKDNDGHRQNIMSSKVRSIGTGYETNGSFYTQNYVDDICPQGLDTTPVYDGSHFFIDEDKKTIVYMSNYNSEASPIAARVIIVNTPHNLTLDIGTKSAGSYAYRPDTYIECQQYYFEFDTSPDNKTVRYPERGYLNTVKSEKSQCPSWSENKSTTKKNSVYTKVLTSQ